MADPKKEIDYRLRPAKHVERKMICEALHQLAHFARLKSYRYVGFGARYFVDFSLFHKSLGIEDMVSIEKDKDHIDRYEFNRPFKCIQVKPGTSNEVLPLLSWNDKTILWLDYTGKLNEAVLTDIQFFFANATAGSVFLITVNATINVSNDGEIRAFREGIDLPPGITDADLAGPGCAKVSREVIAAKIAETLAARNGALPVDQKVNYSQIFNFQYRDSARMLTVGGILWDEHQKKAMRRDPFGHLSFVRKGARPFEIDLPSLTLREIRHLDTHMPIGSSRATVTPIPDSERDKYHKIYRYFPTYTEAEL